MIHRPNVAMDAPPTSVEVGGDSYNVNVDFCVWIDILKRMRQLYSDPATLEEALHNKSILTEIQRLAFGKVIDDKSLADVISAVIRFASGYPHFDKISEDVEPQPESNDDDISFDFDLDINAIVVTMRMQYGLDLSFNRQEPFHWWLFLLYFENLTDSSAFAKKMQIRVYSGDNKEMLRQKQRARLPYEPTADEQKKIDEFNRVFGD